MVHVMDICPTNDYQEKVAYFIKFVMPSVLALWAMALLTLRL
jgi:hypothetical protein